MPLQKHLFQITDERSKINYRFTNSYFNIEIIMLITICFYEKRIFDIIDGTHCLL